MAQVLQAEIVAEEHKVEKITEHGRNQFGLFSREFLQRYGLHLLRTTSTWFFLDITFYSQNLFQIVVFSAIGWIPMVTKISFIGEVLKITKAQTLIALCSAVRGYWFKVAFIDIIGRFSIQLMGFFFMTVFMFALAIPYYHWTLHANRIGFVVMYALTFFFANFSPNAMTFVVPDEIFLARLRFTCHGIFAAAGKQVPLSVPTDATCKKDDSDAALANQCDMCNFVMFTWVLNSLSPNLYAGAIYAKSAYELYADLKETYDKVDGSAIFNVHMNINSLTQSGTSLAEYYNDLNSLWTQFDAMVSLPACTCKAAEHFEKHNQLIKLMQFLMGLDDNYLAIRSNNLTREQRPLVKVAFAIVSGEESHRNITTNGANRPVATVYAAKFVDKKKANNNNNYNKGSNSNSKGPNPNLKCTNCNKIRHIVDRCFEIVGYPAGYVKRYFIPNLRPVTSNNSTIDPQSNNANSNVASKSPVYHSNEQLTRLMNLLNDNGVSYANANMSGANQHMTVFAKFLINVVDISNLGLVVGHPNGMQALITQIRDLKLNDNITLYDVLVVPEYTISLLSDHKFSSDNKLFVGFNENNARRNVSNCSISTCFLSKTLWHQRLGHPADPVLDVLKGSLNLDSQTTPEHLCDTCNKAK
nr:putative ribonuclease H-like domain-containing protein [Tanacetum cinerariifolium]